MILSMEQLRAAARGAAWLGEREGLTVFHRFTPRQEQAVVERWEYYRRTTFAPAGVRLCFRTDSRRLHLELETGPGPDSRRYFAADVCVDGRYLASADNFFDLTIPADYGLTMRPVPASAGLALELGPGEKAVQVYLPCLSPTGLRLLELDDGASFLPEPAPERSLLFYGDSITQGFDALHPRLSYAALLADALGLEERDLGISGDKVFPELAAVPDGSVPAAALVAYGTNDWVRLDADVYEQRYVRLLAALTENYPGMPVFALTPLTRCDADEEKHMGPFSTMGERIRRAAGGFSDVHVIDCTRLLPRDPDLFADGYLHPNDEGMGRYAEALLPRVREILDK